jgi:carboxyl-terminal processing protease
MKNLKSFSILSFSNVLVLSLCACRAPKIQSPTPIAADTPVLTYTPMPMQTINNAEYLQVFEEVWETVNASFFDPEFGGVDWEAVHTKYEPLIGSVKDEEALYQLLNQMLWELKVSHAAVGPIEEWPSAEPLVWKNGKIGIEVRILDGEAVITRLEAGSPADKTGLRLGFIIHSIDGTSVEQIIADTQEHLAPPYNEQGRKNILTNHLLSMIFGDPGTCVRLSYLDEKDELHERCIERIQRPRVGNMEGGLPPTYLEFESKRLERDIGYIRFNTFHADLMPDLEKALTELQDTPGIILDLRGNPGGDFTIDGQMAAKFLDGQITFGKIMTRAGTSPWLLTGENAYTGPLVILIDELSFSGSEFVASGLQAAHRAVIIGERSPGGASAGNVRTLSNGAVLVYPIAQLLTPDGKVVEGRGVIPDNPVALERSQLLEGMDAQLEATINYIIKAGD